VVSLVADVAKSEGVVVVVDGVVGDVVVIDEIDVVMVDVVVEPNKINFYTICLLLMVGDTFPTYL
jgi:hypothetical protein